MFYEVKVTSIYFENLASAEEFNGLLDIKNFPLGIKWGWAKIMIFSPYLTISSPFYSYFYTKNADLIWASDPIFVLA